MMMKIVVMADKYSNSDGGDDDKNYDNQHQTIIHPSKTENTSIKSHSNPFPPFHLPSFLLSTKMIC